MSATALPTRRGMDRRRRRQPSSPVGQDRDRQLRAKRRRRGITAWGFSLPFAIIFAVFMALPVLSSFVMSFTDMTGAEMRNPLTASFVGLQNYSDLLHDDQFLQAAGNTLLFVAVAMPLTLISALVIASLMNSGLVWFRTVFRVGYYMPVVTSIVAISVVWMVLLNPEFGFVNAILSDFGIQGPDWLHSTTLALPCIILMATWRNVGYSMIILLAGLQGIPEDLYEAASLDGAGGLRKFRSITVPMLRPTILFCAVITGIGYLQFFEESFVMTQGGPQGTTMSVAYDIYNQFGYTNYGYASAMSYVLFIAVVILSLVQFRVLRSKD